MSLNDRLNKALEVKQLRPAVAAPVLEFTETETITLSDDADHQERYEQLDFQNYETTPGDSDTHSTLEAGIKVAESVEPDEFGTRIIIVEEIGQTLPQLPIAETILHKYVIDDIQKIHGGGYEVHLVEK